MADKQLVLAVFADEAAADDAVASLKNWEAETPHVRLGALGVIVVDETGQLKEHKLGARSGGKGAGIGLVLAVVAPPTLLAGMVGGGILGHFHHQGLGLSADDRERIGGEIQGGKAAVGVLVPADEGTAISAWLTELGGAVEVDEATEEALEAVAAAAATADTPTNSGPPLLGFTELGRDDDAHEQSGGRPQHPVY
ncbi:MAG TPA: hypothetical protein VIK13_12305 [Candidatus Limnocylindrales bacterium]